MKVGEIQRKFATGIGGKFSWEDNLLVKYCELNSYILLGAGQQLDSKLQDCYNLLNELVSDCFTGRMDD